MDQNKEQTYSCPLAYHEDDRITLAHGGGGRVMNCLISQDIFPILQNNIKDAHDSAEINPTTSRLAMTTDSYVVKPLFFPGGDIGNLSVFGTCNDLAMSGARPRWISLAFVLEEGFSKSHFSQVMRSIAKASATAGVRVVTGDTKVIERANGDGLYVNTTGVGEIDHDLKIASSAIKKDDAVILSGDLGRHSVAVLARRHEIETSVTSDCMPLYPIVSDLLSHGISIHCLRDLTRGGLGSALNELAESSNHHITIEEQKVAVIPEVQAFCELLGFDPLYLANEGRFICFVPSEQQDRALEVMRQHQGCENAACIGHVTDDQSPMVTLKTNWSERILPMLSGEQLPRIC